MAQRFHLSLDGPKPCSATVRECPVGGEHFENTTEAQTAYEAKLVEQYGQMVAHRQSALKTPLKNPGLSWAPVETPTIVVADPVASDVTDFEFRGEEDEEREFGSFKFRDLAVDYEMTDLGGHYWITMEREGEAPFESKIYCGHHTAPKTDEEVADNFINALEWADNALQDKDYVGANEDWHS